MELMMNLHYTFDDELWWWTFDADTLMMNFDDELLMMNFDLSKFNDDDNDNDACKFYSIIQQFQFDVHVSSSYFWWWTLMMNFDLSKFNDDDNDNDASLSKFYSIIQ